MPTVIDLVMNITFHQPAEEVMMFGVPRAKFLVEMESFLDLLVLAPSHDRRFHLYIEGNPFFKGIVGDRAFAVGLAGALLRLNPSVAKAVRLACVDWILEHVGD